MTNSILKKMDAILIDDDVIVRMSWQMVAKKKGKALQVLSGPAPLLSELETWDPTTPIYIDSNLGAGILGENVARELYERGFQEVYLCTGYPASQFAHLSWLKGVLGKESPWI